jgi:hypothetical protein
LASGEIPRVAFPSLIDKKRFIHKTPVKAGVLFLGYGVPAVVNAKVGFEIRMRDSMGILELRRLLCLILFTIFSCAESVRCRITHEIQQQLAFK